MHLQSLGFVQWCECTRQESDRLPELLSTVPRVESFVKGPRDFPATPGLAVHLAQPTPAPHSPRRLGCCWLLTTDTPLQVRTEQRPKQIDKKPAAKRPCGPRTTALYISLLKQPFPFSHSSAGVVTSAPLLVFYGDVIYMDLWHINDGSKPCSLSIFMNNCDWGMWGWGVFL